MIPSPLIGYGAGAGAGGGTGEGEREAVASQRDGDGGAAHRDVPLLTVCQSHWDPVVRAGGLRVV